MLTDVITALGPLKLIVAGILFFNLAWIAMHKGLAVSVVGLSVGETSMTQLHAAAPFGSAASHELICTVLAHALLAVAIWFSVRQLQLWARTTVRRHEEAFRQLVAREERQTRAAGSEPLPAHGAVQAQH
jgi:hypothetical protein